MEEVKEPEEEVENKLNCEEVDEPMVDEDGQEEQEDEV